MKLSNVRSIALITVMVVTVVSSVGMVSAQAMLAGTPQTVDEQGWDNSIALDVAGIPHICYVSESGLNYTSQNPDGTWTKETLLPATGSFRIYNPSLAISVTDKPYVAYWWESGSFSLARLMSKADDGTWIQLGSAGGTPGWSDRPSLSLDSAGTAHISHHTEDGWIRYSNRSVNGQWTRETVDNGGIPSLALDANGIPHISYYDYRGTHRELKYASRNSDGTWTIEVIEIPEYNPAGISLAFDAADIPHISYYSVIDETYSAYKLQYASRNSDGTWATEVVNPRLPLANSDSTTTLAFDVFGVPHILYYNNSQLGYASRNSDGTWNTEFVDLSEDMQYDLAFDDAGVAHISYTYGALKYFRGVTEQSVAQEVLLFSESLTVNDFKSPQNYRVYISKLNALANTIKAGNYAEAQDKIANDLMKRNDQWGNEPATLDTQLAIISADIAALQAA